MAISPDVVRRLTVVATERGLTSLKQNLRETDRAFDQVAASSTRAATATEAADRRMMALLRQRDRLATAMNAGGLGGVGRTAANDIGNAAAFATSRLVPMVAAAGTAVVAFKALNAVWERGTELMEKYSLAGQRALFGDNKEALEKLIRFQNDKESLEQVKNATALSARLEDARFSISEVLKTHINVTDAALKLQGVWVTINEKVADVLLSLSEMPTLMARMGNAAWIKTLNDWMERKGWNATPESMGLDVSGTPDRPTASAEEAMRLARNNLTRAMSGGKGDDFNGRFNAINDIPKAAEKATKAIEETTRAFDQYDNALQRLRDQNEVLQEQIKWLGKTTEEVDRLRAARELERAAAKAGKEITPELRAEIDAEAATYARLREELRQVNEQRRLVESFGSSIVSAFMSGGDAVKSLTSSLASLGQQLASKQLSKFLNGDFSGGSAGGLFSMGGLAGMVGAGAMGYQSGSGLTGALGGALTGFSVGGPLGALAGGAIGGIAGLFGGSAQRRQQQAQMQAQANDINRQAQLAGIDTSTRSGSMQALRIQQQGEIEKAAAERNWASVMALRNLHRAQEVQLEKDWNEREAEIAKQKREEELRLAEEHAKAVLQRNQANADRAFLAGLDTSTLEGAVLAAERAFQREREAEIEAGGEALISLELAHAIELQNIRDQFNKQEIEKTKQARQQVVAEIERAAMSITDWMVGVNTSAQTALSPSARLAASQQAFNATNTLALGSNPDALNRWTKDAQALLDAAQAMFGSGSGFQSIRSQVLSQGQSLPAIANSEDPVVRALNNISKRQEDVYFGEIAAASDVTADLQSNTNSLLSAIFGTLNGFPSYYSQMISQLGAVASAAAAEAAATQAAADAAAAAAAAEQASKQAKYDSAVKQWQFMVGPYGDYSSIPGANNYLAPPNPAAYGLQQGGLVPGFAGGGMVGNGIFDRDSVLARYAGGGNIALAGGEFVMPANQTRMNLPQLEAMRSGGGANDNEVRALRRDMAMMLTQLTKVAAQIPVAVRDGFEKQNRVIKSEERTQSDDKKARRRGRAA